MAVMCSTSDHRIYEPGFGCYSPSLKEQTECQSRLVAKIHGAYCKALERLTAKARPAVAARMLYGGGFCFGLLDPASNIIANTLTPCKQGRGEAPSRERAGAVGEAELKDLERRSLDGLVTFLTRFFPYLEEYEAVRYLLLADADALVAARIAVADRRMKRFGSSGPAVEEALRMALKCAALAAGHPEPDRLVSAWLTLSGRLDDAVRLLARVRRRSPSSSLLDFARLLDGPPTAPPVNDRREEEELWRPWQLAASRRPHPRSVPYHYQHTTSLKRALLDAIHGFYLQAVARLPAGELRSRLHRSLLLAGHCYGPLDPVSNIIVNTVWYDAAFPRPHELEMDMLSTLSFHRIGTRSLYGLVSYLCTRYHHLDFHESIRRLLEVDANPLLADHNLDAEAATAAAAALRTEGRTRLRSPWSTTATGFRNALSRVGRPSTGVHEAFKAAAVAARHPDPDAQASFLASCKQTLGSALPLLQGGGRLSADDVRRIARLLSPDSAGGEQPPPPSPLKAFLSEQARISKKVMAALKAYQLTANGEPMYELHVICGVNRRVSGPVYSPEAGMPPYKSYHSHVNFLATPKGANTGADGAPVLFFAELTNDDADGSAAPLLCCRVSAPPPCAERVRCLYCDFAGTRIVHPVGMDFHGREVEFEKMVCGEDPCDEEFNPALMAPYYTNLSIIRYSRLIADAIGALEEDYLYVGFDGYEWDDEYDVYE